MSVSLLAVALLSVALGCASKPKVWVDPRIDLGEKGTLGLVQFTSPSGYGEMATRQFVATVHQAQAGVPILELGTVAEVLDAVGLRHMGPGAVRAIGEKYGVDVVVLGHLDLEKPKPNFSVNSLTNARASADIEGTLTTRMLDAGSGATIWSEQAMGQRAIASFGVNGSSRPSFGAVDPDGEESKLVSWLVRNVTGDFRGYWARP
jgi:hypothetical protein